MVTRLTSTCGDALIRNIDLVGNNFGTFRSQPIWEP